MSKNKSILWVAIIIILIVGLFTWHSKTSKPKELQPVTVGKDILKLSPSEWFDLERSVQINRL